MFSLKVLPQSNLQEDHAHSVLIAALRGGAAIEVAAAHLRAALYQGYDTVADPDLVFTALAFLTGFAHQAVVIFFALSGWLVGGGLLNKTGREHAIRDYAVDRITRLWIVLMPVLLLMLFLGIMSGELNAGKSSWAPGQAYSVTSFFGNLFGLQTLVVPVFGDNFPLWSLANETWYYILFPLLVFGATARATPAKVLSLAAIMVIGAWLNGALMLYFSIWLMGAACSRLRIDASQKLRGLIFAVFVGVSIYFRLNGKNDDLDIASFPQDLAYTVAFLLFLVSMQYKLDPHSVGWTTLANCGRFFAGFSFTLYVLHVPLIGLIQRVGGLSAEHGLSANNMLHLAVYCALLAAIVLASYLFHLPFEANTHRLRHHVKRMLGIKRKSAVTA